MLAQIQIGMVIYMNLTTQEYEKLYQKASKTPKVTLQFRKRLLSAD